MRILHIAEAFGGGLMQMVVAIAEGSAARGHDALIAYGIRPETPTRPRDGIDSAVQLRPLPWTRRTPDAHVRAGLELRSLLREWRPDVVHLHSSFAGLVGALVIGRGTPTVFSPNAFASEVPEAGAAVRAAYRAGERFICRRVTVVGAVSHSEAELARRLGARRFVRIPNGIPELDDPRLAAPHAGLGPSSPPRIVATGRTVPQRLPEASARILAAAREFASVEWLGGGGGKRGVAGHRALVEAGVTPSGWLPREDLLTRLGSATAYLHWTAWDGLPLSILEALALDVAVVASDIPPNREILGPAGVRETEEGAVQLLQRVVEDPGFAEELRAEQRARRREFGASLMVARWHDLYDELLAESPPGAASQRSGRRARATS